MSKKELENKVKELEEENKELKGQIDRMINEGGRTK